ncbi:MAG: hypothetical protein OSJ69_22140 [Acetatifactor sp.]|nr:hypothetical protein [Acetatifactor sp.]
MSTVYIEIDELAVNALVAAQKYGRNFVSYKLMEDYGFRVVEILHNKGVTAILLLSRDRANEMLQRKADLFEEQTVDGERGISLRNGKTIHNLIDRHMEHQSLRFLVAFRDVRAMSVFENAQECAGGKMSTGH